MEQKHLDFVTALVGTVDIENTFEWITAKRENIQPRYMESSHIMNVVRMIWNHSVPAEHRFSSKHRYYFGPTHNPAYMAKAVKAMTVEIMSRNDWRQYYDSFLFIQEHLAILRGEAYEQAKHSNSGNCIMLDSGTYSDDAII